MGFIDRNFFDVWAKSRCEIILQMIFFKQTMGLVENVKMIEAGKSDFHSAISLLLGSIGNSFNNPSRITDCDCAGRNVLRDNAAGADDGAIANFDSR